MKPTSVKLATAVNPMAARLIQKYQITDEKLQQAKNGRKQWTPEQYQQYLKTEHWQAVREKALKRYGRKCYLCGVKGDNVQIDIHHNEYGRLGGEKMSDLIPLCRECHQRHHFEP